MTESQYLMGRTVILEKLLVAVIAECRATGLLGPDFCALPMREAAVELQALSAYVVQENEAPTIELLN